MLNRYWPTALLLLAVVVLGWYLVYTELLMREMRRDAIVHSRLYLQIIRGLNDPRVGAAQRFTPESTLLFSRSPRIISSVCRASTWPPARSRAASACPTAPGR